MAALQEPDDVRGDQQQQQRDAEPDETGLGEQQPEQVPERIGIAVAAAAANHDLQPGIEDRLRELEFDLARRVIEIAATPISAFFDRTSSSNARTSGAGR